MQLFSLSLIAVLGVVSGKDDLLLSPDGEKKFVVVEAGELESWKEQSHGDNIADEGRKGGKWEERYYTEKFAQISKFQRALTKIPKRSSAQSVFK